jgi:tRNA(Ile)-lysidine synthase
MALASLYARARKTNTSLPKAHGFIVDHKVRAESTEEAAWVAEQLRSKREAFHYSNRLYQDSNYA